ncbi:MAG: carboxyl transferase domain-containing protein, partial [Ignavibacteria bacterium]
FEEKEKKKLLNEIIDSYETKSNPLYAAARLWIDEIIDPALTREYVSMAIELADNNPEMPKFNVGVIQT